MNESPSSCFTASAQQALARAREEADRLGHHFVTPEHLLLGLTLLNECMATRVLMEFGVESETLRFELEPHAVAAPDESVGGRIPWTRRLKHVLALAAREAKSLQHSFVGTGHILLALLNEEEGFASKVLRGHQVEPGRARQILWDLGHVEEGPRQCS